MFKVFSPEMLNQDGIFRTYLEDLIFIEKTSIDTKKLYEKNQLVQNIEHPVYGKLILGKWHPVYAHRFNKKSNEFYFLHLQLISTPWKRS